jgi:hypothetical protein
MGWIHPVHDKDQWRALATMVTNTGSIKYWEILGREATGGFSRTQIHGVSWLVG